MLGYLTLSIFASFAVLLYYGIIKLHERRTKRFLLNNDKRIKMIDRAAKIEKKYILATLGKKLVDFPSINTYLYQSMGLTDSLCFGYDELGFSGMKIEESARLLTELKVAPKDIKRLVISLVFLCNRIVKMKSPWVYAFTNLRLGFKKNINLQILRLLITILRVLFKYRRDDKFVAEGRIVEQRKAICNVVRKDHACV